MRTPKATYDFTVNEVTDERPAENAWSAILDNRFKIEVQRTEPYMGVLCIWDGKDSDKLLFEEEVPIGWDARFGPDVSDLSFWQEKVCQFIDHANLPSIS